MFPSATALLLAALSASLRLTSAYSASACFSSLKFPTFPEAGVNALTYDAVKSLDGLFEFQMEYDHAACAGGEKGIALTLNGPNVANVPCALTTFIDDSAASTYFPSETGLESTAEMTLIDLFCGIKHEVFIAGEQYTLTASIDVPSSLDLSTSHIFTSTASEVFTLAPVTESASESTSESENVKKTPLSMYGPPPANRPCPSTHSLCPVSRSSRKGKVEWMCMDMTMLTSCGGCPNILPWEDKSGKEKGEYEGEDCSEREGVDDVICDAKERKCIVQSCAASYTLVNNACVPRAFPASPAAVAAPVSESDSTSIVNLPGQIVHLAPATGIFSWFKNAEVVISRVRD